MPGSLTNEQKTTYARDGLLFPLPALNAAEVAEFRAQIERLEKHYDGRLSPARIIQPHLFFKWAHRQALHPKILDAVASLLGPDILVHSTSIFSKQPRDSAFVSWHQDGYYWALDQPLLVSAWVALTASDLENGCLLVLPGSHRQGRLAHGSAPDPDNMLASGLTLEQQVAAVEETPVTLSAGMMSLHHVDLVHGSAPNRSDRVRMGFAIRYCRPDARQKAPHHATILARGEDRFCYFERMTHSLPADFETALKGQEQFRAARLSQLNTSPFRNQPIERGES